VTELEWSLVDMQRNVAWIHADQAKARKSIHISLNATAKEVLRKQIGKSIYLQGKSDYSSQY